MVWSDGLYTNEFMRDGTWKEAWHGMFDSMVDGVCALLPDAG